MMKLIDNTLEIRKVNKNDLIKLWEVSYRDNLEWMKWNGPYFNDPVYSEEAFINNIGPKYYLNQEDTGLVLYNDEIIGMVSYHFADGALKHWIEFGIVIYRNDLWGLGLGSRICRLWMNHLFTKYDQIPHLGFTTWSGNLGMMGIGESLNMTLEARIRKVRYTQGQYWDSIKYGILRNEFYHE